MPLGLNQIKEKLSIAFTNALAAYSGMILERKTVDYDSVDCDVKSPGELFGYYSPTVNIQLKATSNPQFTTNYLKYKLPIKNYNELIIPKGQTHPPRILVVLVLPNVRQYWIQHSSSELMMRRCAYWISLQGQPPSSNSRTVTIYIPRYKRFTVNSLQGIIGRIARNGGTL